MAPSNPKRPPRPPRPPVASASKKEEVELPFDDDEVAPLNEEDPRPQRVPQFPAGPRRTGARRTGARDGVRDRELATRFDTNEYSDPGHVPVFLYVEKGPGAGQLIPVKQGPLVIGRASVCELRLQHPSISRRHAQLMRQGERFMLRDLGSQNGTFVNRIKISADQEIVVGDELSLGNAVLKLRGPGAPPEKEPAPSVVTTTHTAPSSRPRRRTSLTRVALVAAAVGSGVAALLTLAFLKFSGPAQRSPSSAPAPSTESAAPPQAASPEEPETEYVPPPPATEEEQAAAPQEKPPEESPRALKSLKSSTGATASGSKASGPRASSLSAKSLASRKGSKVSASAPKATARQQEDAEPLGAEEKSPAPAAAPATREAVLSLYEAGDVDEALSMARGGQLEPLAKKLSAFQSARNAGQEALNAQDSARAIQYLSAALAVDQELSQGWAKHAQAIRKQVGKLYTQLGQDQLKAKDKAAARESFEMALKYDPTNTWARSELQQLNGK